jgi:sugar phosphate isomerase/epimerase
MISKYAKYGLSSDIIPTPLDPGHCELIRECGFDCLEIMGRAPHYDLESGNEAARWRGMIEGSGLVIRSFHPPLCDLYAQEGGSWTKAWTQIARSIDHLVPLGAEYLILHGGALADGKPEAEKRVSQAARHLEQVLKRCQQVAAEIKLCVEHEGDNILGIHRLLSHFRGEDVGFCFDSCHAQLYPGSAAFLDQFDGRIFSVHLSDTHGSEDDHLPPFQGVVDWERVIDALARNAYAGPWHLEVSGGADGVATLRLLAGSLRRLSGMIDSAVSWRDAPRPEPDR